MAVIVRVLVVGISLFYLPTQASPTNWFYDAPRALFGLVGSASAAASAPVFPGSYIADLRRRQEKTELLENGKDLTEQTELLETDDIKEEMSGNGEGKSEEVNEASPSLLEKKFGKILTKLRLIAQIKNAYHYKPETHEHESNITFNITSVNQNQNITKNIQKEDLKLEPRLATTKGQLENEQPTRPASAYGIPNEPTLSVNKKQVDTGPLKIQLDVNQINDKLQDFNPPNREYLKEHEPGKFGTLGVFFAELLGSIVGLTYGAFAQLTSGDQSPVTISTSEGL